MWNHITDHFTPLHDSPLAYLEVSVDLLPMCDFNHHALFSCTLFVVSYADPADVCHLSLDSIKNITFLSIPIDLIKKVCEIWSCEAYSDGYRVFQYLNFPLKSSNFVTDNKYYQLFSLKWQAHVYFWEHVCQIPTPE